MITVDLSILVMCLVFVSFTFVKDQVLLPAAMNVFSSAPIYNVQEAQCKLANYILCVKQANLDSLIIVLGDFNKGDPSLKPPKYRQYIKCPTRADNTLDHRYSAISSAYHTVSHTALGHQPRPGPPDS